MANLFPRNSKIIGSTANKELNGLRTVGMEKDGQIDIYDCQRFKQSQRSNH